MTTNNVATQQVKAAPKPAAQVAPEKVSAPAAPKPEVKSGQIIGGWTVVQVSKTHVMYEKLGKRGTTYIVDKLKDDGSLDSRAHERTLQSRELANSYFKGEK